MSDAPLRILEVVQRTTPLGVCFWDPPTATHVGDGINVSIRPRDAILATPRQAIVNRSGYWIASGMHNLHDFEFDDSEPVWPAPVSGVYRIEVTDPARRFVPFRFDTDLPWRDLLSLTCGALSPPESPPASPPVAPARRVPVFSAPTRPVPEPLAVVRAELRELGTERPAAWAMVRALINNREIGLGMANDEGRLALVFPYPEPMKQPIVSPPPSLNEFAWDITLQAYYTGLPASASPPSPPQSLVTATLPDLCDVLEQLAHPRRLFGLASPPTDLTAQHLEYRRPLIVRSTALAGAASPYLYIEAP